MHKNEERKQRLIAAIQTCSDILQVVPEDLTRDEFRSWQKTLPKDEESLTVTRASLVAGHKQHKKRVR